MPVHGSFVAVLRKQQAQLPQFMAKEADRASQQIRDATRKHTPVGRIIDPATGADRGPSGALQRSIRPFPTRRVGNAWIAGAYSNKEYASYVEYGTRRHLILGHPYLAFWDGGRLIVTRRVDHPGTAGHHMFFLGTTEVESTWAVGANSRLQAFLSGP